MSSEASASRPPAEETQPGAVLEADPAAEKRAEELLRKHDASARFRTNLGWWGWLIAGISVVFTAYHIWAAFDRPFNVWMHSSVHLAGALVLIFLLYPANKKLLNDDARVPWKRRLLGGGKGVPWYDVVLSLLGLFVTGYIFFNYDYLVSNQVIFAGHSDLDKTVAVLGVLLVLEATRRTVGLPIVIIALVAGAYAVLGNHLPRAAFGHRGMSVTDFAVNTFLTTERGIWSTPIQVSASFIFLFLFFATMLIHTNIGQFFNDLAFRLTGRMVGGPAKAAVVASGLQGMISGSSVANTVGSGSFTIPMMKKAGFRPEFAGATEATASTGGQMMPPIMGAAAFIMVANVGIGYNELILIAVIPALLYFTGAFIAVHFEARRMRIKGMPKEALPSRRSVFMRMDLLLPLVVIVGALAVFGVSPMRAALLGIGTAFVLSFFRASTRLGFRGILNLLSEAARVALPVIAACASAGIIAGTVAMTGLGGSLGRRLVEIAGGSLILLLIMVMIACIILGMGLPTTANYVVTATVAAPALVEFGVPLIAAHMFVFFFGLLADVTPPVCLAAFAGAGLAGANPMKTGVVAMRVALAGFLIPYVFVLEPALLMVGDDWYIQALLPLATLLLGMMSIAAAIAGNFVVDANIVERVLLIAGGLLLVVPNTVVSLIGLAVVAAIAVIQWLRKRAAGSDDDAKADAAPATA